ncbi:LysM peptidoglycan-binding domain-containing protein [Lactobacillus sp. S2-2]|uniref:aggregation-promoting factor n=1 Tax=Lactobacillus sp. S2-2 TaxID=2692917 RepID=UPI001F2E7D45|nr:LysM peptidoglycan-binding domain-containing protein [Lactobacillus sp. S2-2]MCF6515254.1 LysM peptidoglycan-binding domain-containing protein [Lactobacillus sp. S2-2]
MAFTVIAVLSIFLIGLKISTSAKQVTVKSGDTVSSIAKINQLPINRIIRLNNLKNDGNDLQIGQTLKLSNSKKKHNKKHNKKKVNKPKKQVTQPVSQNVETQTETPQMSETTNNASVQNNSEEQAKNWIASHESTNSYDAQNGRYVGKYQLDSSYLNGDYSPANQEIVANNYVTSRYGSWVNAQNFWMANGWY